MVKIGFRRLEICGLVVCLCSLLESRRDAVIDECGVGEEKKTRSTFFIVDIGLVDVDGLASRRRFSHSCDVIASSQVSLFRVGRLYFAKILRV